MILLFYILIPAVAAPVAWLLGRSSPALARWTAVARHGRPAGAAGRAVDRQGERPAGDLRGQGARPVRPGGRLLDRRPQGHLDRLARHQLLPRRRRPHAHHAAAHVRARPARRARLLARHHRARRRLPLHDPLDGGGAGRRVPLARPVPLLLLLRDDAHPDVLPHRRLGSREARVRGDQVLHLHPGQRPADAGGDHRAGGHPRARDRRLHLRLHAAAGHADGGEHGLRPHARVLLRLRRQAAGVAAAHLAAGRAHRGADRRLRAAGRRAHQDRRLRHAPLHGAALPRRRARLPHLGAHPGRDRHHLRRAHGLRPEGHEAAGRLHERQPHGLRAPRDLRLEHARRCRA